MAQGTEIKTRGGTTVGYVLDGVFTKTIFSARGHILRKPPAIGFDLSTLQDAQRAGARMCWVHDGTTGRYYWATMEMVFIKGFPQNRGAGAQQFLPLNRWRATRPEAEQAAVEMLAERGGER